MTTIKKTLPVTGMHCATCSSLIKKKLEKVNGVISCNVNFGSEKVKIEYDSKKTSVSAMNHELSKYGYSLIENASTTANEMNMDMNHEAHEMMTPLSSDKKIKEQKLVELAKLKNHVQIILPLIFVSIITMLWEFASSVFHLIPESKFLMEATTRLMPVFATYALFVIGLPYLKGVIRFIKYQVADRKSVV